MNKSKRKKRINQLITLISITCISVLLNGALIINMLFNRNIIINQNNDLDELSSSIDELEIKIGESEDYYTQYISQLEYENDVFENEIASLKNQIKEQNKPTYITGKIAYLTFDDGPSSITSSVLDVLDQYNVKATFFVLGSRINNYPSIIKRMVESGHTIGNHSMSHDYAYIYRNLDNLQNEIVSVNKAIYDLTGYEVFAFRFPGGSSNTMFNRYGGTIPLNDWLKIVDDLNMIYYDWNVSSLDASNTVMSAKQIADAVLTGAKDKTQITVLMHDAGTKKTTLEALPAIIEGLQAMGYEIRPLTYNSKPIQHRIISN